MKSKSLVPLWAALALVTYACEPVGSMDYPEVSEAYTVSHEMIVLGDQLEDPYSFTNITKAVQSLYGTKAERLDISPTNIYVRFLPKEESEFETLRLMGVELIDHPFDYEVLVDGDYYRDPSIAEDEITWQYAVVPADFKLPDGIRYEILDECYIPQSGAVTRAGDVDFDWDRIEREAFRLTGNEGMLEEDVATRAGESSSSAGPCGTITIVDPDRGDGMPMGVAGVKVSANVFVKFASAYTDEEGAYQFKKRFSGTPRYRIIFQNKKGFGIGLNLLLVQGSVSTLGKNPSTGVDYNITASSDRKLFCRAVVNNAAYDYYRMCEQEDCNVPAPPKNLRIWLFQRLSCSSAPMLRQGTILDKGLFSKYLGEYRKLISMFLPDITVGLSGADTYAGIYSRAIHELAHSSHFMQVGLDWWDRYIMYILESFLLSGGTTYGAGTENGSGYCEVGEMWGYYMQNQLYMTRYSLSSTSMGMSYWFCPQIFLYMDERGLGYNKIIKALNSQVKDIDDLKSQLYSLYPEQKSMIQQAFERYNK